MYIQKNIFSLFIIGLLLLSPISLLLAGDFPTKPVNLVAGFGPGGTTDLAGRAMTDKMAKELEVPIIVLNKPGSAGLLGAEYVARSKPDGYNLYVIGMPMAIRQAIDPQMAIDILKDFEPISMFVVQPMIVTVRADSKFKTIDDLIDFALRNPGKLVYGSPGIGSGGHFCGEVLKANTKINFKHVPFKSDGETAVALMGGHIDFLTTGWGQLSGKVASGDFRILLSFDEIRYPEIKDVPTLKEKGFPEAIIFSFYGFVAPAGTPKEIIEKLDRAAKAAAKDPVTAETFKKMGFYVNYKGSTDFGKFLKSEVGKYITISKICRNYFKIT